MTRAGRQLVRAGAVATGLGAGCLLAVRGALTLDVGVGRRIRPLGPIRVPIGAPRETVFDVITAPYLGRTPRAMAEKLDVLERGTDMVLAAHFTPSALGTATTVETVGFERPDRVRFRLLRGPVPLVKETFELRAVGGGTELEYRGELGTDFWFVGSCWGVAVARVWVRTVRESLDGIRAEAERRAARRPR